jgi:hypothetical protein
MDPDPLKMHADPNTTYAVYGLSAGNPTRQKSKGSL